MAYLEKKLPITDKTLDQFSIYNKYIKEWSDKGVKYIRCVIDEDEPSILIHFSGTSVNELSIDRLLYNDLFNRIINKSFNNIAILKSLYNRVNGEEILTIINQPFNTIDKYLFALLADSNGYLIYHHQFESFIQDKIECTKDEALKLRKSWNKKIISDRGLILTHEHYWLIENRMPFYFTFKKL